MVWFLRDEVKKIVLWDGEVKIGVVGGEWVKMRESGGGDYGY